MKLTLTQQQSVLANRFAKVRERVRNLRPVAAKMGEFVTREARRRAPRGISKMRNAATSLAASLNHVEPAHNETVLQSPLPYAKIQNTGGTITAGTGKLGAKYLAIPISDMADQMLGYVGSGTSLRDAFPNLFPLAVNGKLFLVRFALAARGGERKNRRSGRTRATRVVDRGLEFLFILKRSVTLQPNPAPNGYAPRMNDPAVKAFVASTMKRFLTTGVA